MKQGDDLGLGFIQSELQNSNRDHAPDEETHRCESILHREIQSYEQDLVTSEVIPEHRRGKANGSANLMP